MNLEQGVLMTKNLKKIQLKKIVSFFDQKMAIYLSLGLPKGRPRLQATGEDFSPRKRAYTKNEIQYFFYIFVCHVFPSGARSGSRDPTESTTTTLLFC
jgi:hypothetical protein